MSIFFKPFYLTSLLCCEMEQRTCGEAIGREKPASVWNIWWLCAAEGLLLLNLPRDAVFLQDKLYCRGNIVLLASSFDNQGEGGGLQQRAFKHLLLPSPQWCLSSGLWNLSLSACSPESTLFHRLAPEMNYTAEVKEKTKANQSASGQVDSPTAQQVYALTTPSITGTAITQTQGQAASCRFWTPSHSMATQDAPSGHLLDHPFLRCGPHNNRRWGQHCRESQSWASPR